MQVYMVGGAVRDALLGLPVNDRDWVVVGATPEQMIRARYLPVGKDFPVFLHPETREEYALARTERKTARGYHGFAFHADPGVTLEQDLARRDLTINAMAQSETGEIIDPFDGRADLQARVLRHVTDAFREDPVRILRVARFAARFHEFTIAPHTCRLMREMVDAGEVDALVAERVWQELARGLMEPAPSRMFDVLRDCGALIRLLPEVDAVWNAAAAGVLDRAAARAAPLPVRFACVALRLTTAAVKEVCERLRVPNECRELAEVVSREHRDLRAAADMTPAQLLQLLERCDAIRKPKRFEEAVLTCELEDASTPAARLALALKAALGVSTSAIAAQAQKQGLRGPEVGALIHAARTDAIASALRREGNAA